MVLYRNKPLVSVCIPTYNSALYLKESLESIVHQTYDNLEIIVSDNNSNDNTNEIINKYVERYGIKYYRNKINIGAERNFNKCISMATGEFISIYHADDIYNINIVSESVRYFMKYENIGAVFTMAEIIDEGGEILDYICLPKELKRLKKNIYNFDEIFRCIIKYGNSFLVTPSAMVKKSIYDEIGGWEYEKYKTASDLGLWLKIAGKYDVAIIDNTLMKYRISLTQGSHSLVRFRTSRSNYFLVIDEYNEKIKDYQLRGYYHVSEIKDLIERALNLSTEGDINNSNKILKLLFIKFFSNLLNIFFHSNVYKYLLTALLLIFVNHVLSSNLKEKYKNFVMRFKNKKY